MDILDEARQAVLLQRARTGRHDALVAQQALELATLGGARALGLDGRVGSLEVGKDADLAAFGLDEPRGIAAGDVAATLVYSLAGRRAALVTVAGRELVRDGVVLAADPALPARVAATTDALRRWTAEIG
jgi:5-methylthioadenosine/S-adenosylhomocysteine deaminase